MDQSENTSPQIQVHPLNSESRNPKTNDSLWLYRLYLPNISRMKCAHLFPLLALYELLGQAYGLVAIGRIPFLDILLHFLGQDGLELLQDYQFQHLQLGMFSRLQPLVAEIPQPAASMAGPFHLLVAEVSEMLAMDLGVDYRLLGSVLSHLFHELPSVPSLAEAKALPSLGFCGGLVS